MKTINLKLQKRLLHLVHFSMTFDPSFHAPITKKLSMTTLPLNVNIVVNNIPIVHADQNDLASIKTYNTVLTQSSLHGEHFFWDNRRQEYTIQNTSLPSQRLVVPPQEITALSHWCHSTALHQPSSLTIKILMTHLSHCATLLQWVFPQCNCFAECINESSFLMFLLLTNPSLTTPSSSLLFRQKINLSRMQQFINHLLDLHLFLLSPP